MSKSEFTDLKELSILEQNLIHLLRETDEQPSLQIKSKFEVKRENIFKPERLVSPISPDLWPDIGDKIPSLKLPQVSHWLNYLNFAMLVPIP